MLAETIAYRNVYIITGYTDMRKSINGLVAILTQQYQIKPDAESLYLFCGKRADRMKAILWEEGGRRFSPALQGADRIQIPVAQECQ